MACLREYAGPGRAGVTHRRRRGRGGSEMRRGGGGRFPRGFGRRSGMVHSTFRIRITRCHGHRGRQEWGNEKSSRFRPAGMSIERGDLCRSRSSRQTLPPPTWRRGWPTVQKLAADSCWKTQNGELAGATRQDGQQENSSKYENGGAIRPRKLILSISSCGSSGTPTAIFEPQCENRFSASQCDP